MENMQHNTQLINDSSGDSGGEPIEYDDKPIINDALAEKTNLTSYSFVRNTQQEEFNQSNHSPPPLGEPKGASCNQQFMAPMGYQNHQHQEMPTMMQGMAPGGYNQMAGPMMVPNFKNPTNEYPPQMAMGKCKTLCKNLPY
jgi:hypothetical protein